ncbi:MAG: hypothetical protein WCA45_01760 [Thiobacillaceae bacterium]
MRLLVLLLPLLALPACGVFNDPATDLAYAIEGEVDRLGQAEGASYTVEYAPPSRWVEHSGTYTVQFDKVGALIVWYKDADGKVTASGSTSYVARFVDIPRTYIVDKPANSVLSIELHRQNGRGVVTNVQ